METDRLQNGVVLERRYAELREEGGRHLSGVAVRYGEIATGLPWQERFAPGAFGDVGALDVFADVQHERGRLLARTGGGGLVLSDSPEALRLAVDVPETREGDDALTMVRRGVLRGWSVTFRALKERMEGAVRVIERARLHRVALVDVPAYSGSLVEARAEIRADGQGLRGSFFYNRDRVVSDRAAVEDRRTPGVRKRRVSPGAFNYALQDLTREVMLTLGYSYERPLAARLAEIAAAYEGRAEEMTTPGLRLVDGPDALTFEVDRLPDTSYVRDLMANMASGNVRYGVDAVYTIPPEDVAPDAVSVAPEPEGDGDALVETVNRAVLTSLAVVSHAPRGNPGAVSMRRRRWW